MAYKMKEMNDIDGKSVKCFLKCEPLLVSSSGCTNIGYSVEAS